MVLGDERYYEFLEGMEHLEMGVGIESISMLNQVGALVLIGSLRASPLVLTDTVGSDKGDTAVGVGVEGLEAPAADGIAASE